MDDEPGIAGRKIVLATGGSLGDLHPFLALPRGLQSRGCEVLFATNELYRMRVEGQGISVPPDPASADRTGRPRRPLQGGDGRTRRAPSS
ncbi:MAG: glycosyltransferase [Isosphaeraceae bacterium]